MGILLELKRKYSNLPSTIGKVIKILSKLRDRQKIAVMTVVLCADGVQKMGNNGTKRCDLYGVLNSICGFLNASTAFTVCVCSTTFQMPIEEALADSFQLRVPDATPNATSMAWQRSSGKTYNKDPEVMGGAGRALESLHVC
ncbi:TPA: hypothetical protein N0F65_010291 [Lagenidium giganteum]|uniref:Uncharacterized protein n=1 Tax=Lagenidium giganteum TaxID=4803 RepID=A0AAV2ZAI7_9STRA|nr:TPA: hypothetical protein N0F65_010291 [Lagenidium giganteum]